MSVVNAQKVVDAVETLVNVTREANEYLEELSNSVYGGALSYSEIIDAATLLTRQKEDLDTYKRVCMYLGRAYTVKANIFELGQLVKEILVGDVQRRYRYQVDVCKSKLQDVVEGLLIHKVAFEHHLRFYNSAQFTVHGGKL